MNIMEKFYKKRLERTEQSLKLAGAVKCKLCKIWLDKEYIIKDNICNLCFKKEEV